MKLKVLYWGLSGIILLTSCNSKGAGSENDNVSDTNVFDSSLTETVIEENVDPQDEPIYRSDDLKKFGLKGTVKKVSVKPIKFGFPGFVKKDLVFDDQGNLTSALDSDFKIKVNDEGFIYKVTDGMGASDGSEVNATYTLNENGWPVKIKLKMSGPEEGYANLSLTYPEVDDAGNWTKCIVKGNFVTIDDERGDEYIDPIKETITRVITY